MQRNFFSHQVNQGLQHQEKNHFRMDRTIVGGILHLETAPSVIVNASLGYDSLEHVKTGEQLSCVLAIPSGKITYIMLQGDKMYYDLI